MTNLKVQTTAWPDGGYDNYGPEGMEPIRPRHTSRIEYQIIKKRIENTVRPGGAGFEDLNSVLDIVEDILK